MSREGALHRAARQLKTLSFQLMPRLADPIDLIILIPDTFDLRAQLRIPLMPG